MNTNMNPAIFKAFKEKERAIIERYLLNAPNWVNNPLLHAIKGPILMHMDDAQDHLLILHTMSHAQMMVSEIALEWDKALREDWRNQAEPDGPGLNK